MVYFNLRYISESYLDALCRQVSWNAEGGSKCKIGHFRGSCFTPKVTQFRLFSICDCFVENNGIREWIRREVMLMSSLEVASSSFYLPFMAIWKFSTTTLVIFD